MAILNKSQQVNQYLRNSILQGKWSVGEKLPAERELIAELGVSHQVIREAMSQLAHEGLIERKQGSGTYVAPGQQKGTIAILAGADHLSSSNGYFYQRMLEVAKRRIEEAGYRAVLAIGHGETAEAYMSSIHLFDKAVMRQTVGVLSLINPGPMEELLAQEGIPLVSTTGEARYSVSADYAALTRQAVDILKARGIEEFALMHFDYGQDKYDAPRNNRILRLVKSTAETCRVDFIEVPFSLNCEHAYEAFKAWWARPGRPRTIFFYDDGLCDVSTRAILELGIKVPADLAILSFANVGRRFHFPVPLTGIGFDADEGAEKAWGLLSRLIRGEKIDPMIDYISPRTRKGFSLGEPEDRKIGELDPGHRGSRREASHVS